MFPRPVTQCLTNKVQQYLNQYLNWVRDTIINDLLSCRPAAILLDNARIISCDYITDPWVSEQGGTPVWEAPPSQSRLSESPEAFLSRPGMG
ncbi:hypothetical protein chiPu_0026391, partial [Chiloscyllium punctatum]|nr:hypothetical protein [Chiloscyllium punctatum]